MFNNLHLTAIKRKTASAIAKYLVKNNYINKQTHVFDYGCGYGKDVLYYRSKGIHTDGYDPHKPFGWHEMPDGKFYDVVTVIYVINVLPEEFLRKATLEVAAMQLRASGKLVVAARSISDIESSKKKTWKEYGDGWITNNKPPHFQKGFTTEEIEEMVMSLHGFVTTKVLNIASHISCVVAETF